MADDRPTDSVRDDRFEDPVVLDQLIADIQRTWHGLSTVAMWERVSDSHHDELGTIRLDEGDLRRQYITAGLALMQLSTGTEEQEVQAGALALEADIERRILANTDGSVQRFRIRGRGPKGADNLFSCTVRTRPRAVTVSQPTFGATAPPSSPPRDESLYDELHKRYTALYDVTFEAMKQVVEIQGQSLKNTGEQLHGTQDRLGTSVEKHSAYVQEVGTTQLAHTLEMKKLEMGGQVLTNVMDGAGKVAMAALTGEVIPPELAPLARLAANPKIAEALKNPKVIEGLQNPAAVEGLTAILNDIALNGVPDAPTAPAAPAA